MKRKYSILKAVLAFLCLVAVTQPAFNANQLLRRLTSYLTEDVIDTEPLLDCKASQSKLDIKDLKQLKGRTIYFIGDSTMRQQFEILCIISGQEEDREFLTDPNKALDPSVDKRNRVYLCENEDFRALFLGQHRHGWQTPEAVEDIYNQLVIHDLNTDHQHSSKPDVVYFNGALHFLHLEPFLAWRGVEEWHEAESLVNKFVDEVAGFLNPGGSMIYMRAHAICEEKFRDSYQDAVAKFSANPIDFAQDCVKHILKKEDVGIHYPWDSDEMVTACWQSTLTSDGVARMNKRVEEALLAAVEKKQSLLIGCVDGYKLTSDRCEDTQGRDGRHYRPRVPYELRSLVESVSQVYASNEKVVEVMN